MPDSRAVFEAIYAGDRWGGGSGPGSTPAFCAPLVDWLADYIARERVKWLVDLGCGDFQWMPAVIAATGVGYAGLDVVEELLAGHRSRHPGLRFLAADVATAPADELPEGDLYWAKDVLQHWSSEQVETWLARFFAARPAAHLVVCNCSGQRGRRRLDSRWRFAPLSASQPPLAAWRPEVLFEWGGKEVVRLRP